LDADFRAEGQAADTRRRSIRRRNTQVRATEQVQNTADYSGRRLDPDFRVDEQALKPSGEIKRRKSWL